MGDPLVRLFTGKIMRPAKRVGSERRREREREKGTEREGERKRMYLREKERECVYVCVEEPGHSIGHVQYILKM